MKKSEQTRNTQYVNIISAELTLNQLRKGHWDLTRSLHLKEQTEGCSAHPGAPLVPVRVEIPICSWATPIWLSATSWPSDGPLKDAGSVPRLQTDDQVLSHCPPSSAVLHKGATCTWDQGMMHVARSFRKVIWVCVKTEGLKEPRLGQKEISTILFKSGISNNPGPEFHDSDLWSHKNIEKVEWITVKYFQAWPKIAWDTIASVAGMHLNRAFSSSNKQMCSALYTAHRWQTRRAWSDRQEYWDVCEERRDSLN